MNRLDQNLLKKREVLLSSENFEKQHKKGKLAARERLEILFDPGSFRELDAFVQARGDIDGVTPVAGDGVITGFGKIEGRLVFAYAQDFLTLGGSLGYAHAQKICKVMDQAVKARAPFIGLSDSGGARIQEGVASLGGYGDIFFRNVRASGKIPQISLILGPCAGGAVYSPAITDFVFMVEKTSHMFITGPDVVAAVTGEKTSFEDLGGARTHAEKSGVIDAAFPDEVSCMEAVKQLLRFLPRHESTILNDSFSLKDHASKTSADKIANILPEEERQPYEVREIINALIDDDFFEIKADYAANIRVGFAKMGGQTVGIVANNPQFLAGVLDTDASVKAARFIRMCDSFHIPLLTLVDVPGFLPGISQESGGIIRHGAKLLYAYAEATVPKITLILRKAFGGAYVVMSSKHIGADFNFAWPQASIAVMGAEGASRIIYKREIEVDPDPVSKAREKSQQYAETFNNPYQAAKLGFIDQVILPEETRAIILDALDTCKRRERTNEHKLHGNIPL